MEYANYHEKKLIISLKSWKEQNHTLLSIISSLHKDLATSWEEPTHCRRRRGQQRMKWLDGITDSVGMGKLWEMLKDRGAWRAVVRGVTKILNNHNGYETNLHRTSYLFIRTILKSDYQRNKYSKCKFTKLWQAKVLNGKYDQKSCFLMLNLKTAELLLDIC